MINYNEYFGPLPDVEKYLNRIAVNPSARCDLEYLHELILAHQYSVPFENLDIFDYHQEIDISTKKIFDKVVNNRRGGYCFELNTLFYKLLLACEYDAFPILARVIKMGESFLPPLHRLTIVKYEENLYVCDVGFGGAQPGFALKIEENLVQSSKKGLKQTFKITEENEWYFINYLSNDSWSQTMMFKLVRQEEVDFVAPNFYTSKNKDSAFTQKRMVNLRTEHGNISIVDDTFIQIENHVRKESSITNDNERRELLDTHFGIKIESELEEK